MTDELRRVSEVCSQISTGSSYMLFSETLQPLLELPQAFVFGTKLAVTTCTGLVSKVLGTFDSIVNLLKCRVQAHMYTQNHPHTHTHTLIFCPMSQQERVNSLFCVSIIFYWDNNTVVQHLKAPFYAQVFYKNFHFGYLLRKCERATHYLSCKCHCCNLVAVSLR